MAGVTNNLGDWKTMYDGFDPLQVGIGLTQPNIYHSDAYAQLKQQVLLLGCITDIIYAGYDHDLQPQVISMAYEPQYNTVICYNLHYLPEHLRKQLVKFVLDINRPRITENLPMVIPYPTIKNALPYTEGIVRRYKVTGIRVIGNVPVKDWPKAIKGTNRWQDLYRGIQNKK